MDDPRNELTPEPTAGQIERWHALVDILYLVQLFALYLVSLLYPFFGLIYGILLLAGGISPKTKKIGRVCLILGIVNLALCILVGVGFAILSITGILAGLGRN